MDWSSLTPAVVIALGSLLTAFCSFFVACFNYRRSNHSVIRVIESMNGFTASIYRGQYSEFRIVVQNLGIPLHNIGMSLVFTPDGFGGANLPLKSKDGKGGQQQGQFPKGAITEFTFATDKLDRGDDGMLKHVTDLKAQRVRLILHSDSYKMWSYPLHDRLWWFKKRWNHLAFWLTHRMRREVKTPRGTDGVKFLFQVPVFKSAGKDLLYFISQLSKSQVTAPPPNRVAAELDSLS